MKETVGVASDPEEDVRVQILNGNGVPGIGQDVARKLVGQGFRLILSGNAQRLDYRKTLVITYENSEQGIALAERARDLIGVGEVQVSAQEQGIVDLTIVVGKDYLRAP
jgi:polyisoprenyl-teichoic acid--peptidoglycan teichoic acid transferase